MTSMKVSKARAAMRRLVDEASESYKPTMIRGRRSKAVPTVEEDWRAIQETLDLLSIPGMRESIREGPAMPADTCGSEAGW